MALLNLRRPDATTFRPRASLRDDAVTVVLGLWFVVGLLLDAWAHNNLEGLESFFTPWHGVFYSGFAVTAAWITWLTWRNSSGFALAAIPVGYGLGVVGLPMFALAGLGDMIWHTVFGVEQSLRILFSPTHLGLVSAMVLIVTSPLRSAWANPDLPARPPMRRLWPAVVGLSFGATLVLLLLQYANALAWMPDDVVIALSNPLDATVPWSASPIELVSAVAVTNVVLLAPLLILARRWSPPPGSATVLFATLAGLAAAITALNGAAIILGVILSGALVDLLLVWLRPSAARRPSFLLFAGLAPVVVWSVYLAAASAAGGGLPRVTEYWTGLPVAAGLMGLLLAVIALPSRDVAVAVAESPGS
jgi:hypothetical protein